MRIWSLHPKYLDAKGILALWREALLARKVLEGKTKGYKGHPQLERFLNSGNAVGFINQYLIAVYENSLERGYKFGKVKLNYDFLSGRLTVTDKQLSFEKSHLLKKLETRDQERFRCLSHTVKIDPHPLFKVIPGEIETWEKI